MVQFEWQQLKIFDRLYLPLIILGIAFLIFGNGTGGNFVLDDGRSIFPSPRIRTLEDVPTEFFKPYYHFQPTTGLYRPLTQISYLFNLSVSDQPLLFHVVNILLHAANSWLIFLITLLVFRSRRISHMAAAIFLFLPINVEAVTYIGGRADLLSLFFSLLTFFLFISKKYWLSGLVFLAAILSKEVAIIFPLFLVFYLFAHEKFDFQSWFKKLLPFGVVTLVYVFFRKEALGINFLANDNSFIANPLTITDGMTRILTSFKLIALYAWKTFVPIGLSADYGYPQIPVNTSLLNWAVVAGLAIVAGVFILIFHPKTRRTPIAFGLAVFLALYFPISNFVFPIGAMIADRFIYAGSAGLVIAIAASLNYLVSKAPQGRVYFVCVLLVAVLLYYGIKIIHRNRVWLNEESLVTSTAQNSPKSISAQYNLGLYYLLHDRREEGIKLITEANSAADQAKKELGGY